MPVIYPVMSRYFTSSEDSLTKVTQLSLKYLTIIGIPTAIGSLVLADSFINLFYGVEYSNSILAFQILAFFIPIRLLNSINWNFIIINK